MTSKIAVANKKYYSSKGKKIYSDFSTFAQGGALAKCNAIEFVRGFSKRKGTVIVCEYGIGKGDFAKNFLDELKRRDRKLYARTRYYLFDFSDRMIADARKNLLSHGAVCIFGKFDTVKEPPFLQFDYCRINELLTDLPTLLCKKEGGAIVNNRGLKPAHFFAANRAPQRSVAQQNAKRSVRAAKKGPLFARGKKWAACPDYLQAGPTCRPTSAANRTCGALFRCVGKVARNDKWSICAEAQIGAAGSMFAPPRSEERGSDSSPQRRMDHSSYGTSRSREPAVVVDAGGKPPSDVSPFVSEFLSRVDEGRVMPFNFTGAEFLAKLCACGKKGFCIDVFDYGFQSAEEVFLHPLEEWNRLMVREYGGQLTVDLNVPFVLALLSSKGIGASAEPQKKYAERVMGKKLALVELKNGLDYAPAKKSALEIIEDDGFFHIRIGN